MARAGAYGLRSPTSNWPRAAARCSPIIGGPHATTRHQFQGTRAQPGYPGRVNGWPEPVERVAQFLRDTGTEARIEEFGEGTPTAEDAARAAGCKLDQIVKSLVFVCDGNYVLAMVPGDQRGDAKRIAAAAGAKKARVAGAEQVVDATG